DPALAASISRRIDYLLIDDLDRAEPAQVEVFARIATRAHVMVSIDPDGMISDRAARSIEVARRLLGLDVGHPTHVLPPPCPPSPAIHTLITAALPREGIDAVDAMEPAGTYDPAVRYVLAWLRVLVDPSDDHWERALASPHARVPAADAARLCHWAGEKKVSL